MIESYSPFRVISSSAAPFRLDFRHDVDHSLMSRSHTVNVGAVLESDSGFRGYGESVPRKYVTGETTESAVTFLDRILPSISSQLYSSPRQVIETLSDIGISATGAKNPAGVCALDLALLDLAGKHWNTPVSRLLGLTPHGKLLVYSLVVPLFPERELRKFIDWVKTFDFEHIKIKVGTEDPAGSVQKIQTMFGGRHEFRVDANCSWSVSEAHNHMKELAALGVVSVEQPLQPDEITHAAELRKDGLPLIVLDESISTPDDVFRIADAGACDIVNVRISKCGGILGALRVVDAALKCGLGIQLGAHVGESCILSAAGAQLASVVPQFRWLEGCFGTYLLRSDLCKGEYQFGYGGRFTMPAGPGLGVTVSEEKIKD